MIMRACLGSFNAMIDQTFSDGKLLNILIKNLTYLRLFKAIPKLPDINQRCQSDDALSVDVLISYCMTQSSSHHS